MSLCRQLLRFSSKNLIRNCQPIRHHFDKGAYEGEGKTTVTILNRDADYGLMVDAISTLGFRLNLNITVFGPMLLFPRSVVGWNIESASDINEDSLVIFKVIDPRPDIVVLGLDKRYPRDAPFLQDFEKILTDLKINIEILPVNQACTTFNFLNAEKRYCVGAFMPPSEITSYDMYKIEDASIRRSLALTDETPDSELEILNKKAIEDAKKLSDK